MVELRNEKRIYVKKTERDFNRKITRLYESEKKIINKISIRKWMEKTKSKQEKVDTIKATDLRALLKNNVNFIFLVKKFLQWILP